MSGTAKIAALGMIAALLREVALQDLAQARLQEATLREDLSTLAKERESACADARIDFAAARQLESFRSWTDARRQVAGAALAEAMGASAQRFAAAQRAAGRTEVLAGLSTRLAAEARAKAARKV